jgi:hypothetical protein
MSIPHFSDLSKKRQQIFINNLDDFTVEEKLDGSNFRFKLDYEFPWACRKTSSKVYHTPEDWGTDMWVTGFRAAHKVMTDNMDHFKNFARAGELYPFGSTLNSELLFVDSPNTLVYGKYTSSLVIYEPQNESEFCMFASVQLSDVPFTVDGCEIKYSTKSYEFAIMNNPASKDVISSLKTIDPFFEPLTAEFVNDYILENFVRDYPSDFTNDGLYTPIEGLVFKHKDGWMFKVVDREWFTAKNKENYIFRNGLFKSPRGYRKSFMDCFWNDIEAGSDAKSLASKYLVKLDVILNEYWLNMYQNYEQHIHEANLRALASIRKEMINIETNGLPNE